MSNIFSSPLVLESVFRDVFRDVFDEGGTATPAFSPLSLFASGEEGAWYEPSTTTAFKSTTDLTPCGYGDSCGFLLDKSQGAGYSGGSFTGLGSNLIGVTSASNWTAYGSNTVADDGDAVVITFVDNQYGAGLPLSTLAPELVDVSKRFLLEFEVKVIGGAASMRVLNFSGNSYTFSAVSSTYITQRLYSSWDGGGSIDLTTSGLGAGEAIYIRNISVREIPGNHATQGTASARPILARVPEGGRRNLLEKTEQFDDAVWVQGQTGTGSVSVTADQGADPNGNVTADRVILDLNGGLTSNDRAPIYQSITFTSNTFSIWLKSFDGVSTYDVSLDGSGLNIVTVTGSWQRFSYTGSSTSVGIFLRGNYAVSNSADLLVWGAQLETGSTATAYQKVVDQYDVTEAGVTSLDYLAFDGSDDGMATASIDFTATDKMSVFAGVEKESETTAGVMYELSTNISSNNGSFLGVANSSSGTVDYRIFNRGTGVVDAGTDDNQPQNVVLSHLADISGDSLIIRIDGAQIQETTTDPGTANYGNYPLNIGARNNAASDWFDGKLFSLIVRGASSTANEISNTETYLANRSGVTL